MNLEIQNKKALVCGSTQGIGRASAMGLAAEGVNVTLIARNEEKLKAVLSELPNNNQNHSYISEREFSIILETLFSFRISYISLKLDTYLP